MNPGLTEKLSLRGLRSETEAGRNNLSFEIASLISFARNDIRKKFSCVFIVCYLLLVSGNAAYAVSSEELIKNAGEYDGKEVAFQGEVIGDIMKRGDFCWVNISDGKNAVGVFSEAALFSKVVFLGDYNHAGDIVQVKGVFHRACLEHGGDLDIHADSVTKIKDGYHVKREINQKKVRMVLWLSLILFMLVIVTVISRRTAKIT